MTTVSLDRCDTYETGTLEAVVRKVVDLTGGISRFVKPGDRVLIKPNLLSAKTPRWSGPLPGWCLRRVQNPSSGTAPH